MLKFQSFPVILVILLGPANHTAYPFGKRILSTLQNQGKTLGYLRHPLGECSSPPPSLYQSLRSHVRSQWWGNQPTRWSGTLGAHLKLTFGSQRVLYDECVIFACIFFLSFRFKERRKSAEINLCKPNTEHKVRGPTVSKCPVEGLCVSSREVGDYLVISPHRFNYTDSD